MEWPLNSKTALFIWRLIDEAVIFIHSLSSQIEQIFAWPVFPSSHRVFLCFWQTLMQHHCGTEAASPDFVINSNGVIKLRTFLSYSVFMWSNDYSALMSLLHCPYPALISKPHCDTQGTFDNEVRFRGWGEASSKVTETVRLERSVFPQGCDMSAVGCHSEVG